MFILDGGFLHFPHLKLNQICRIQNVHVTRIERSVSACFFNIAILPISFPNAKWIWTLLEILMIELYLYIKTYLDYLPGRLK